MYVAHALQFPLLFYRCSNLTGVTTATISVFDFAGLIAWLVCFIFMIKGHVNCKAGSEWMLALSPGCPFSDDARDDIAYVKCIFSGFQLALASAGLLGIVVLVFFPVFIWILGDDPASPEALGAGHLQMV
ncbi:hypothetical protein DACRYDRAFT_24225 [Dacryopinax primogenitus]|uniref:Uncharacterized protein n=1 Tax=Dacryopinax primogenitus (strain DJM 731) TaxID=1858805 RepID=M5FTA5_DACPD|nr:uncharacterized protein DACRYDRAFT_24225 [Dacryopinax primogenitus]EJT98614.1 hypothetical protein DACRYDRAFT_24225 [Dacryopinax primogenitus]